MIARLGQHPAQQALLLDGWMDGWMMVYLYSTLLWLMWLMAHGWLAPLEV